MPPITRGFTGRRRASADPSRLPPGQYLTEDFPVLSAGPTPHTRAGRLELHGRRRLSSSRMSWSWAEFLALPVRDGHRRHPLRHQVVQARHALAGRLARHPARGRRDRGRVPDRLVRRRLHDQPAARGRDRRQGLGRLRVRRASRWTRARRPGAAAGAAPVLLEERQVGARADAHAHDEPGFWESYGYHNHGDPWREQRYQGD